MPIAGAMSCGHYESAVSRPLKHSRRLHMAEHQHHEPGRGLSRGTWVLIGFLAVAAYFLLSEHQAHFIQFLPLLLLAACPLMHLFHGHGGHRGRGGHGRNAQDEPAGDQPAKRRPRYEGDSQ
jgi:hypothetical protein